MRRTTGWVLTAALWLAAVGAATAENWTAFRGSSGSGVSSDARAPLTWSSTQNVRWKAALPGPGASSPIVVGDRVFLTCYSGYGVDRGEGSGPESLQRHLVCINRADGRIRWSKSIAAVQPEDPYSGYLTEHGYASNTPISDGERVYAFFGKSGVFAFDLDGNQLWRASVGTMSSNRRWGSAASPLLYRDLLIVNASDESRSLRALDRKTGKEIWKAEAEGLELAYGTPTLVEAPGGKTELALGVPGEVWGLNPDTGKLTWYASIPMKGNICPTLTSSAGVIYVTGGFPTGGCVAIRAGGKGDVSGSHVLWTSRYTSYVPTPVVYQGHLYWVNEQGVTHCLKADTGELVYQERLKVEDGARPKVYASTVVVGDRLVTVSRNLGTFILAAKPAFQQIAVNRLGDESVFNGTPAVSDGQLFLRSNRFLYCLQAAK